MTKENMIRECEPIIYNLIKMYSNYNKDDLYQAGICGVLKAFDGYDLNSNCKFTSYAFNFIRGEMIEFIRKDRNIKISDKYLTIYKHYLRIKNELEELYGRSPSFKEICFKMGINESELASIIERVLFTKSLDTEEVIEECNIDSLCLKEEIDSLEEPSKSIIKYRYYYGYTQQEVASMLGLSQVKVSREETASLKLIKQKIA